MSCLRVTVQSRHSLRLVPATTSIAFEPGTLQSVSELLSGLANFASIPSLKYTYSFKCAGSFKKYASLVTCLIDQHLDHSGTRKLSVIRAVNTHAYLIHPLGSAWYQCFVLHSLKFLAGHKMLNITQNKTKQNQPTKKEEEEEKRSLGSDTAMLVNEERKQIIYILLILL